MAKLALNPCYEDFTRPGASKRGPGRLSEATAPFGRHRGTTMLEDILVPIAVFGSIAAMVIAPFYFRSRDRAKMLEVVRVAYDRGQPVPPDLIEAMQTRQASQLPSAERDLRSGVIWLAVGLGVAFFGWMMGFQEDEAVYPIIGMASIPALVGVALIVLGLLGRNRQP